MKDVCDWALKFTHREEMYIFPLRSIVGEQKMPVIRDWEKYSSMNMSMIEQWFRKNPDRGVGLPCGKNGLIVVDCDRAKANGIRTNGVEDFRKICAEYGDNPSPVWQRTPSGGMHYFYKMGDRKIGNKTQVRSNGRRLNLDIKGERGYVAICAAPLIRVDGRMMLDLADYPNSNVYTRQIEGVKKIPLLSAAPPFPEWMYGLLVRNDEWAGMTPDNVDIGVAIERCAKMIIGSYEEYRLGNLNNIAFSFMQYFRANPDAIEAAGNAFMDAAVSCGHPNEEVATIIDSARKAALDTPSNADVDIPRLIRDAFVFKKETATTPAGKPSKSVDTYNKYHFVPMGKQIIDREWFQCAWMCQSKYLGLEFDGKLKDYAFKAAYNDLEVRVDKSRIILANFLRIPNWRGRKAKFRDKTISFSKLVKRNGLDYPFDTKTWYYHNDKEARYFDIHMRELLSYFRKAHVSPKPLCPMALLHEENGECVAFFDAASNQQITEAEIIPTHHASTVINVASRCGVKKMDIALDDTKKNIYAFHKNTAPIASFAVAEGTILFGYNRVKTSVLVFFIPEIRASYLEKRGEYNFELMVFENDGTRTMLPIAIVLAESHHA